MRIKKNNIMEKKLENLLWKNIRESDAKKEAPRFFIDYMVKNNFIKSPKQAWRTLEKWLDKNLYDYGTALDLGWRKVGWELYCPTEFLYDGYECEYMDLNINIPTKDVQELTNFNNN
jgi:hypothetical protein